MGLLLLFQPPQRAWTPADLTSLKGWYQADTLTGSDGDAKTSWSDNSGVGNNASTGGNGPLLRLADLNGKNVLDFEAANSRSLTLPSGMVSAFTAGSTFWVAKTYSLSDMALPVSSLGNTGGGDRYNRNAGAPAGGDFVSNIFSTAVNHDGSLGDPRNWHILNIHADTNWTLYRDGVQQLSEANTFQANSGAPAIGVDPFAAYFDGRLGELLVLNSALTALERQRAEGYLSWKWGLQANLAADHPYKNNAPTVDDTAKVLTAAVGVYTITGTAVGLKAARTLAAAPGAYAITGTAVTLSRTRRLVGAVGAYVITGTATALIAARKLAAAAGAYTITGTVTALRRGFSLAIAPGAYSITGQTTGLKAARRLTAAVGAYSISGTATALRIARRLAAAVGAYVISGQTVALKATRRLAAAVGAYNYTGTATALRTSRLLVIAPGAYAYTGQAAALRRSAAIVLATGSYSINGQPVALIFGRRLQFAVGAYLYTGQNVTLQLVTTPFFPNNDPAGVALSSPLAPALVPVTVAVAPMAVPAVAPAAVSPPQAFVKAAAPGAVNLE